MRITTEDSHLSNYEFPLNLPKAPLYNRLAAYPILGTPLGLLRVIYGIFKAIVGVVVAPFQRSFSFSKDGFLHIGRGVVECFSIVTFPFLFRKNAADASKLARPEFEEISTPKSLPSPTTSSHEEQSHTPAHTHHHKPTRVFTFNQSRRRTDAEELRSPKFVHVATPRPKQQQQASFLSSLQSSDPMTTLRLPPDPRLSGGFDLDADAFGLPVDQFNADQEQQHVVNVFGTQLSGQYPFNEDD